MKNLINEIKKRIVNGGEITKEEAIKLINVDHNNSEVCDHLFDAANEIRKAFVGNKADLCTIMNVKSGKCSEDCTYCSQSAHYNTGVKMYDLLDYEIVLERALEMQSEGAHRFSLVSSGRGAMGEEFKNLVNFYEKLDQDTMIKICASHGLISYEQALKLKETGVKRYHHNVETSPRYYEKICTTHTYEDRINTILNVQKAGIEVCCGGILGLGETVEDRIDMAFEIKRLKIKSVPINILTPVKGTPLEGNEIVSPMEILKTIAIYRLILPKASIRYAGGRIALGDLQEKGLHAGINGALVGNYLTTVGNNIPQDIEMIKKAGFEV